MSGNRTPVRGGFARNAVVFVVTTVVVVGAFVLQNQYSRVPTWEYVYDTKQADSAYAALKTRDDGVLLVGTTIEDLTKDAIAIKLNHLGRVLWQKQWGGTETHDSAMLVAEAPNGDVILAGSSSGSNTSTPWLTAFSAGGKMLWKTRLGAHLVHPIKAMTTTPDGRIVALARNEANDAPLLLVFSANGELQKKHVVTPAAGRTLHDLTATADGYILAAGEHRPERPSNVSNGSNVSNVSHGWLVKIAPDGELAWEKSFASEAAQRILQITKRAAGKNKPDEFACFGVRLNAAGKPEKYWIFTLTGDGEIKRHIWFGAGDSNEHYQRIHPLADGAYLLLAAVRDEETGSSGVRVKKLSAEGEILWSRRYGFGPNENNASTILALRDGGVAVVGTREKGGSMGGGAWVLKLDDKGQLFDEQEKTGETEVVIEENMQFMGTGKKPKDDQDSPPADPVRDQQ